MNHRAEIMSVITDRAASVTRIASVNRIASVSANVSVSTSVKESMGGGFMIVVTIIDVHMRTTGMDRKVMEVIDTERMIQVRSTQVRQVRSGLR